MYRFLSLLAMHVVVARLMLFTSRVTLCVCHAELQGLLTYLHPAVIMWVVDISSSWSWQWCVSDLRHEKVKG